MVESRNSLNDPSMRLAQLSEQSTNQIDARKKARILVEYLEIYINEGGTLKSWAMQHFQSLCEVVSKLTKNDSKDLNLRIQNIANRLGEILSDNSLYSMLPEHIKLKPTLEKVEPPNHKLFGTTSNLNYLLLKLEILQTKVDFNRECTLLEIQRCLLKCGFFCGFIKSERFLFGWLLETSGGFLPSYFETKATPGDSNLKYKTLKLQIDSVQISFNDKMEPVLKLSFARDGSTEELGLLINEKNWNEAFLKVLIQIASRVLGA